ncbi:MAG: DUF485 domain-containing protein [Chloroflexi bacterium]|nr:DUF485 domain-containing protein [Chloroflexota bacterium]
MSHPDDPLTDRGAHEVAESETEFGESEAWAQYLAEFDRAWAEEEHARIHEVAEQTPYGAILLQDLIRRQVRLALGVTALFLAVLFALPLAYLDLPAVMEAEVLGLPLGWLIPAALIYPFTWGLAVLYARRARQHEEEFRDLLR